MSIKIAVIAANGKAGRLITKEAVSRGLDVTAVVRGENKTEARRVIQKDIFDLTKEDLSNFDVVIDAVGTWTADTLHAIPDAAKHLADILDGTDVRLLVVGGAGSLFINPEHSLTLAEAPDFPDDYKPVAAAHRQALDFLRTVNDVKWTYISPAADFQADGARTGAYTLAGEDFTLNEKGESVLSYADYAIAMVDEAVKGGHIRERISVVGK